MGRVEENLERQYRCGKCGKQVFYSVYETPPDCPQCDWSFLEESQYDVPEPSFPMN